MQLKGSNLLPHVCVCVCVRMHVCVPDKGGGGEGEGGEKERVLYSTHINHVEEK